MKTSEQLAILTALKKSIEARIKDVRSDVESDMWTAYDDDGVEKIALKVDNIKVGEIGVTYAKESYTITDQDTFSEFALNYGFASVKKTINPESMADCIRILEEHLDPDDCWSIQESVIIDNGWEKFMTPSPDPTSSDTFYLDSGMPVPGVTYQSKAAKNLTVRGCDPAMVLPIVATLPGGIDALLLGEGEGV